MVNIHNKSIILSHGNNEMFTNLSTILRDMKIHVLGMKPGFESKVIKKAKQYQCCVVDLVNQVSSGLLLIRGLTKRNPYIQIVAIVDKITNPIRIRMNKLRIYHIIERPLKKNVFIQTVQVALAQYDLIRKQKYVSKGYSDESDRLSILVSHNEELFYKKIYQLCIPEAYDIYISIDKEDFIKKVQVGFYNIIFTSEPFLNEILSTESTDQLFYDQVKPLFFLLTEQQQESSIQSIPDYLFVASLLKSRPINEIITYVHEIIPQYEEHKRKILQHQLTLTKNTKLKTSAFSIKNWIYVSRYILKKSRLHFYIFLIAVAAISVFLVSNWLTNKENNFQTNSTTINNIDYIEQLFKK